MTQIKRLLSAALCGALFVACVDDHGHGHASDGSHVEEVAQVNEPENGHAEGAHGHAPGAIAVTLWTEQTELFMEYPALVIGEEAEFLAHLTDLRDFSPVTQGKLVCTFQQAGGTEVRVTAEQPSRPGIFIPVVVFSEPGIYDMVLRLEGPQVEDLIRVTDVQVYASAAEVPHEEDEEEASVSFLKEQQWKTPFRTETANIRSLSASVQTLGEILPKAQAHAEVPAPVEGVMLADQNTGMPSVGTWVKKGQVLAVISPPAETESMLMRIRNDFLLAEAEYNRVQRLFEHQAIPEKRLEETRLHYQMRKASYDRIAQQVDFSTEDAEGDIPTLHFYIEAPINGFVEESHFHLGQSVRAGEKLFTLTNPDRVWLKAKVPLTVYPRIEQVRDASFTVEGYDGSFQVSQLNGRLISVGNAVDPTTRTVPVLFEVDNPNHLLKINLFAEVAIYTGVAVDGLAVPSEAIIDNDGTPVVYVQAEGEAFVERTVQTGIVDGEYTQITSGLEAGEQVVVIGAYQVRLASLSTSVPTGHGHGH